MEKQPLDKIIEKLEKLDIRGWQYEYERNHEFPSGCNFLITKTSGLTVYLYKERGCIPTPYCLKFTNEGGKDELSYGSKKERELVKKFYEKTYELYNKHKTEEFQEKLNNFLSD